MPSNFMNRCTFASSISFRFVFIFLLICSSFTSALVQLPGALDTSFNPTDQGFGLRDGISGIISGYDNSYVYCTAIQPDGKIIVGGAFTSYNGASGKYLIRLNSDGSRDGSFNIGTGFNSSVWSVVLQPDGKILVGGSFTGFNGAARNRILRLYPDGSLDTGFDPGTGIAGVAVSSQATTTVRWMLLQPDGKVVAAGNFASYNSISRSSIVRINADGSLDLTFNPGTGAYGSWNTPIVEMVRQPDGKLVIAGDFTIYNGTTVKYVARVNTDGTLDQSFNTGTGPNNTVLTLDLQPDGKVLIGGGFTSINGITQNRLARLTAGGAVDNTFASGIGMNGQVARITVQPDGKSIVSGPFTKYNGTDFSRLIRINADGTPDTGFQTGNGLDVVALTISLYPDGSAILGGSFSRYDGFGQNRVTRIHSNGAYDTSFNPGTGANGDVYTSVVQPNGKIYVAGSLKSYNGIWRSGVARLHPDGTNDAAFNPGIGPNGSVNALAVQADGKVLIGGTFTSFNGTSRNYIARLNEDGTIDPSFTIGTGANNTVYAISIQQDGRILVGGEFTRFNGSVRNGIVRLNNDGTLDSSFNAGAGVDYGILAIAVQPDGKIILGGYFTSYNNSLKNSIVRVDANGAVDAGFVTGTGIDDVVSAIVLQNDGKILVNGSFTRYNGNNRNNLVRLHSNGAVDQAFNIGTGTNSGINQVAVQPDGKVIIAGSFSSYNGTLRNRIARLSDNGSIDTDFDIGTGADQAVNTIALQPDGKIVIGGSFTSYNGAGRNRITRIHSNWVVTGATSSTSLCQRAQVAVPFTAAGIYSAGNTFTAQLSDASGSFAAPLTIGTLTSTSSGTILATIPANTAPGTAYRLRVVASNPATTGTNNGSDLTINAVPATPVATASPATIVQGSSTSLSVTAPVAGVTYNWSPVSGLSATAGTSVVAAPTVTTTFTVRASANGCTSDAGKVIVTVTTQSVTCSAPVAPSVSRCGTGIVVLSASGGGTGATYRWYNSSNVLLGSGASYTTPSLSASATYAVEAVVGSCVSPRTSVQAVIKSVPAAPTVSAPAVVCAPGSATLTASSATAGAGYAWYSTSTGGTPLATGAVFNTPQLSATTPYYAAAVLSGCESARTARNVTVRVVAKPTAVAVPAMIAPGQSSTLSITSSTSGNSYTWSPATVLNRTTGTTVTASPASTTTFVVTASSSGCTSSAATVVVQVNSACSGLATPSVANAYVCGTSGTATLTASGGGTGVSTYRWYATATATTPFFTGAVYITPVLSANKSYYVAAVNAAGCESARRTATMYVTPPFTATATASPASVVAGSGTTLTASASIAGTTYRWSGGGLTATTATVTAAPAATTTYTVTATRNTCTATATAIVSVTCPGALSGAYTINKSIAASTTNFTSFTQAANRLTACGVAGPVTITVAAGTGPYTEQVELGQIPGTTVARTVTINGYGNTLQFAPASAANYLLRLNGTNYFRVQNLTLTNTSTVYGWGIHLTGGADNNVISGCTVNVSTTATGSGVNGIVASASSTTANGAGVSARNLQLLNNVINGGYYGISLCGDAAAKAAGMVVSGNQVSSSYYYGIYLLNLDAAQVAGNTVAMRGGSPNSTGLYLSSIDNGFSIQRNRIYGFGRYGAYLTNSNSLATTIRASMINNMIGGGVQNSATTAFGVYLSNADRIDCYYNSINTDNGAANSAAFYAHSLSTSLDVRNNAFAYTGTTASYAFYASAASFATLNYNNYYSTGSKFVYLGADKADLAALQTTAAPAGHDVNSYQGHPGFVSATNLHIAAGATQLANRAQVITGISTDIDGQSRAGSPDIGADEYAAPAARTAGDLPAVQLMATVYPNPFRSEVTLQVTSAAEGVLQVQVADMTGRTVLGRQLNLAVGEQSIQLTLPEALPKGLYVVRLQQADEQVQLKLVKE